LTRGRSRSNDLPDRAECLRILKEAGCSQDVIAHCLTVSEVAVKIARRCRARVALVEVGGLLHDIGRSRTHSIDHAVKGAELAAALGLPNPVVLIIERHIGAGIREEEAEGLGLPTRDYVPMTLEEKIVAHADNLIAGGRRVTVNEAVSDLVRRGLSDAAVRTRRLHEELSKIAGLDIDRIV
jgi:uncharacterized protein (TIGR00295 family)